MEWAQLNIETIGEDIYFAGAQKPIPPSQNAFNEDDQRGIHFFQNIVN